MKLELQQVTGANRIPFLLTDKVDIVPWPAAGWRALVPGTGDEGGTDAASAPPTPARGARPRRSAAATGGQPRYADDGEAAGEDAGEGEEER